MSRSERYIQPSEEQFERWRQAAEAARRFDAERETLLRATLKRIKKADLVELTLRVATQAKACQWALEREVELKKPLALLVHDIEAAIDIATHVDEREMNRNPPINWPAYEAVQRGFLQLIQKRAIEEAKALALQLVQQGSYQIECSDEGLMQDEIESCLRPVISAVAELPGGDAWASEMLRRDRMGMICRPELTTLAAPTGVSRHRLPP